VHYVYVLINEDNKPYIGCTNDLRRRLEEHQRGKVRSTRGQKLRLAYYEAYANKSDALRREKRLKDDGRARYQLMARIAESVAEFPCLK
jgi:putative endonuclease